MSNEWEEAIQNADKESKKKFRQWAKRTIAAYRILRLIERGRLEFISVGRKGPKLKVKKRDT